MVFGSFNVARHGQQVAPRLRWNLIAASPVLGQIECEEEAQSGTNLAPRPCRLMPFETASMAVRDVSYSEHNAPRKKCLGVVDRAIFDAEVDASSASFGEGEEAEVGRTDAAKCAQATPL